MTKFPTLRELLNELATFATYSLLAFVAVFSFFVAGDYVSEKSCFVRSGDGTYFPWAVEDDLLWI